VASSETYHGAASRSNNDLGPPTGTGFDCRRPRKVYNRRRVIMRTWRAAMAKGQKRSNREIKKPKADKKKVPATAGTVPGVLAKAKPGAAAPSKK